MAPLHCRFASADDLPAMVEFWREHSGWTGLSDQAMRTVMSDGPHGAPIVILAEDASGEQVGQLIGHRSVLIVDGVTYRALRPFAPIVSSAFRNRMLGGIADPEHPLRAMADMLTSSASSEVDVIHWLPDPRFARFLKSLPAVHQLRFPLYSHFRRDMSAVRDALRGFDWEVTSLDEPAIDELAANAYFEPVHRQRSGQSIRWRKGIIDSFVVRLMSGGRVVGIGLGRRQERQLQIEDALAPTPELRRVVAAAMVDFSLTITRRDSDEPLDKSVALATPGLLPTLTSLGFEKDDYTFLLAVACASPTVPAERVFDPAAWFLSSAD